MKKIALDIDALVVDSFDVGPHQLALGTVDAQISPTENTRRVCTCAGSCDGTCAVTCDTCGASCNGSCNTCPGLNTCDFSCNGTCGELTCNDTCGGGGTCFGNTCFDSCTCPI